jgi:hypothetical protein
MRQGHQSSDRDQDSNRILILFLLVDIVLIALHGGHHYLGIPRGDLFSIEWELGYGEIFQYIKEFWIVSLLALRSLGSGRFRLAVQGLNLAWGLLFLYLLADDSLRIHETLGGMLAQELGLSTWLGEKAQDLGELSVSAIAALVLFGLIAWAYRHSSKADRQISMHLSRLLAGLVLCGVVVDTIHSLIPGSLATWAILEDGGEMIVMSLMISYVFQLKPIAQLTAAPIGDRMPT